MADRFSVEELVINDSFIAYCFHTHEADVRHWEAYLRSYPEEKGTIDEARDMVVNMSILLREDGALYEDDPLYEDEPPSPAGTGIRRRLVPVYGKWIKMAAAAVILTAVVLPLVYKRNTKEKLSSTKEVPAMEQTVLATQNGQKKTFYLPDSSKVMLNAGSSLELSKGFGEDNRTVSLRGEAYFDIRSNTRHPFKIRALGYDITVLGTVFNLKAYAEENTTELDLISGKVQVAEVTGRGQWMVKPLQKLVLPNKTVVRTGEIAPPVVKNLTFRGRDSIITETAWQQNRLEIVNETFGSMKSRLEHWYNIKIVFADDQVREYPFTGYFSNESIQQVLNAFQYSYPFNYKIENDIVTISK